MIKNLFNICFALLAIVNINAQSFWKKTVESKIAQRNGDERTVVPAKYEVFNLNMVGLKNYLQNAPMEYTAQNGLDLEIPMPDGHLEVFEVYKSPVMQSGISARYPSINSYKAISKTSTAKNMRFSVGPNGFYAAINTPDGEKYIDPYSEKNIDDYVVYDVKDHQSDIYKNTPMCGVDNETRSNAHHFNPLANRNTGLVELRVFKLAMACTGEWGRVARRGTVEKCLADINVMMNRMNSIYEKDMAMRFLLIDDNDKLIFLDPATDPYNNSDQGKVILPTNTSVIAQRGVLTSSYDVGHVLSICFDIGGVAQGGSACQSNKGNGVTCNNDNDLTNIVTRVMAHEIGHQFDASHTWNICSPNDPSVDAQRAANFAYEPGSGSTIMSYAGSCGTDNVISDNDDYFHVASLDQMYRKTYSGGNAFNCSDKVVTTNHFPVAIVPSQKYVIPISTPFELNGGGTDEDGDALTYCWEQYDLGPKVALGTNGEEGPLFRSFKPAANGNHRFFPRANSILAGSLTEKTELLPNVARELNFRLTVRDNNAQAGGVVWEDYAMEVADNSGPFRITYPELAERFKVGQELNVTWDVANTNLPPVSCNFVNIYGSYSGALKSDDPNLVLLAQSVPNDGSQIVYIPNRTSNLFRIVIKAADNIFLTTHKAFSRVEAATEPGIIVETQQSFIKICQPDAGVIDFSTQGLAGFTGDVTFELVSGLPIGATGNFTSTKIAAGGTNKYLLNTDNVEGSQSGQLVFSIFGDGIDTISRQVSYEIIGGNLNNINRLTPINGASNVGALPKFNWNKKKDGISYEIQIASSPDFASNNLIEQKVVSDSTYSLTTILDKATIYYWRVRASNSCRDGAWSDISAFITEALSCKTYSTGTQSIVISTGGTPTVELPLTITDQGTVNDLNIKLIKGEHSRLIDLVATLVAPSGKEALLWSRQCGTQQNLNLGLDDQSSSFFQCPINSGKVYRTHTANGAQPLSVFNGEKINGTWKLKIEDKQSGSGGRLQELNLEICSNLTVENPFIVKNEILKIHPKDKLFITNALLLSDDINNSAAELVYTLVKAPGNGFLTFNGNVIDAGAKFSQADINASKLRYESNLENNGTDYFSFIVTDGQGGWISITDFNVFVDFSIPSGVNEINLSQDVFVNPNPTKGNIQVILSGKASVLSTYILTDISGRVIMTGILTSGKTDIETESIANGVYFIKLTDGKHAVSKRIVKI